MKQNVYVINKKKVVDIIKILEDSNKYYGLNWGDSDPAAIIKMILEIESTDNHVHVSKLANLLDSIETTKMIGGANKALDALIKEANKFRTIKEKNGYQNV